MDSSEELELELEELELDDDDEALVSTLISTLGCFSDEADDFRDEDLELETGGSSATKINLNLRSMKYNHYTHTCYDLFALR